MRRHLTYILAAVLLVALSAATQSRLPAGGSATQALRVKASPLTAPLGFVSDLDGDERADQAELVSQGQHKTIRLRLSQAGADALHFNSVGTERGRLISGDVNHDDYLDLIWVAQARSRHTAISAPVVWLGNGHGSFKIAEPTAALLPEVNGLEVRDSSSDFSNGEGSGGLPGAVLPASGFALAKDDAAPSTQLFTTPQTFLPHQPRPQAQPSGTARDRAPPAFQA